MARPEENLHLWKVILHLLEKLEPPTMAECHELLVEGPPV
jgi:hypothetical protein